MKLYFRFEVRLECFKCRYWSYKDEAPHSTVVLWGKCIYPKPVNKIVYHTHWRMVAGHSTACDSFEARRKILI